MRNRSTITVFRMGKSSMVNSRDRLTVLQRSRWRFLLFACLIAPCTAFVGCDSKPQTKVVSRDDKWKQNLVVKREERSEMVRIIDGDGVVFVGVTGVQIRDASAIESLHRFENLEHLAVLAPVSDDHAVEISRLRSLRRLIIVDGGRLERRGIEALSKLRRMEELEIGRLVLQDGDLEPLQALDKLRSLHLITASNLRGEFGAYLPRSIEELELFASTSVDDSLVRYLPELKRLTTLNLQGTSVTDASIDRLAGLELSNELVIADSRITPEGAVKLRNAARCSVILDQKQEVPSKKNPTREARDRISS